jgi:hypothetical protein
MCFVYCHLVYCTYHPAHVKTEYKGAATPSSFFSSHTPLPRAYYTFAFMSWWIQIFLFLQPLFHPSL